MTNKNKKDRIVEIEILAERIADSFGRNALNNLPPFTVFPPVFMSWREMPEWHKETFRGIAKDFLKMKKEK